MKKSLLILALGAIVAVPAQAGVRKNVERRAVPERVQAINKVVEQVQKANEKKVWKPGSVSYYNWNEFENVWEFSNGYKYVYDEETGLIKSQQSNGSWRTDFEYDANGQIIATYEYDLYEGTYRPNSKSLYKYDEIITDYRIEELNYSMENDEWVLYYGSRRNITRNSDGNIIKLQSAHYNTWSETPGWEDSDYYMAIEYGTDGRATRIYDMERDYETGQMYVEESIDNIVWYATDGQIVDMDWDDEEFYFGANRIKSANIPVEFSETPGKLTVTYGAANSVKYELVVAGEVVESLDYIGLDAYGSHEKTEYSVSYEFIEETNEWEFEYADTYWTKRVYDAYGYELYYGSKESSDGELYYQSERVGTVTYDSQYGYPTEYVSTNSYGGGAPRNDSRMVFGDYVQVTDGVESVTVSDENAPVEYFNLQGVRVNNPQGGIFIRRQGTSTSKVVL
ncbi:MAG: hypothetical protein K2M00_00835 [Muribaculaceae bacterium]|nr:hypothetical protein [Muribaculaceae bacterium]